MSCMQPSVHTFQKSSGGSKPAELEIVLNFSIRPPGNSQGDVMDGRWHQHCKLMHVYQSKQFLFRDHSLDSNRNMHNKET